MAPVTRSCAIVNWGQIEADIYGSIVVLRSANRRIREAIRVAS